MDVKEKAMEGEVVECQERALVRTCVLSRHLLRVQSDLWASFSDYVKLLGRTTSKFSFYSLLGSFETDIYLLPSSMWASSGVA
jgi:hypothetical protein